VSAIVLENVKG